MCKKHKQKVVLTESDFQSFYLLLVVFVGFGLAALKYFFGA